MKRVSLCKVTTSFIPILLLTIAFALPATVSAGSGTPAVTAGSSSYSTTSSTSISFSVPSGNVWIFVAESDRVGTGSTPTCSVINTGTMTSLLVGVSVTSGVYEECLTYDTITGGSGGTVSYTAYGTANTNLVTIAALYVTGFTGSPSFTHGTGAAGTCSSPCTFNASPNIWCNNSCVAVGYGYAQPASGGCTANGQGFVNEEAPTSNPCTVLIAHSTTAGMSGISYPIADAGAAPTQIWMDEGLMLY